MPEPTETAPPAAETPSTGAQPTPAPDSTAQNQAPGQRFEVAVLALQNLTLFPETVVPLGVGRPRSVAAVEAALSTPEKLLGTITVRPDASDDTDAKTGDLYQVGTLVMIKRMERVDNGMRIVAQGTERIRVIEWKQEDPFLRALVEILPDPRVVDNDTVEAMKRNLQQMIQEAMTLLPNIPPEVRIAVLGHRFERHLNLLLGVVERARLRRAECDVIVIVGRLEQLLGAALLGACTAEAEACQQGQGQRGRLMCDALRFV